MNYYCKLKEADWIPARGSPGMTGAVFVVSSESLRALSEDSGGDGIKRRYLSKIHNFNIIFTTC